MLNDCQVECGSHRGSCWVEDNQTLLEDHAIALVEAEMGPYKALKGLIRLLRAL